MSSSEDTLGIRAVFDITEFEKNGTKYLAALNRANSETDKFYARQEKAQKQAAAAATKAAQEQERAAQAIINAQKKAAAEAEKAARAQEAAQKKMASDVKGTLIAAGVIIAGMVVAYKKVREEAERLGDEKTLAGFTAMETAATDLGDSLAAMALEIAPVGDILAFLASGVTALSQVLTVAMAGVAGFGTLYLGTMQVIRERIDEIMQGKIFESGMDVGKELDAVFAKAKAAADRVVIASVQAPGRVADTKAAEENKKLRDKELADLKTAEEKRLALIAEYAQKARDLTIKAGEDILSAEADLHAKSAAAWSDYIEKSSAITIGGIKKRAELLSAYTDTIESAESEFRRGSENASYEHGKKLADIERNYQNTLRQIQQDYGQESLDAARNLDALGFRRAQEKRDIALADAERSRNEANSEENNNYNRQLDELRRSLDDKRREAKRAYQRGLAEQRQAEREAQDAAKAAYNAQMADAQAAFNARLSAIKTAYANEDAAARAHYLNEQAAYRAHLSQMAAILAQYGINTPASPTPIRPARPTVNRRAEGGLDVVSSPTQFVAGDGPGPELVFTMPLNRNVPMPVMQTVNHIGDFSHQIDSTIRSSVAGIDGRIIAGVTKAFREVLG